jgi:hypothetical protein
MLFNLMIPHSLLRGGSISVALILYFVTEICSVVLRTDVPDEEDVAAKAYGKSPFCEDAPYGAENIFVFQQYLTLRRITQSFERKCFFLVTPWEIVDEEFENFQSNFLGNLFFITVDFFLHVATPFVLWNACYYRLLRRHNDSSVLSGY